MSTAESTLNKHGWNLENSYAELAPEFYSLQNPDPVVQPKLVLFNSSLAATLGFSFSPEDGDIMGHIFAGNQIPPGSKPLSQAYAGHQFGHFTMLGDGRAVLLGEQITPKDQRYDIQLKGSGRTAFSRNGDGRATLSSMLREYIISEAMHHLGIPGSRSLAVVSTGEQVPRDRLHLGAVLTRVMSSHIRVGTFEFANRFLQKSHRAALLDYTILRHYPELIEADNKALAFLEAVMDGQIKLICQWMRVGFIHGVMNTDNMGIACETFDYGPCAFMNQYDPATVFSSIDTQGRYTFGNQASIAQWNLACLASALISLIHEDSDEAVHMAKAVIHTFPDKFSEAWMQMMRKKFGWKEAAAQDADLIGDFLTWMHENKADYTQSFKALSHPELLSENPIYQSKTFLDWKQKWEARVYLHSDMAEAKNIMSDANPFYIPRNHLVEKALEDAAFKEDFSTLSQMLEIMETPYTFQEDKEVFFKEPVEENPYYRTFCGT